MQETTIQAESCCLYHSTDPLMLDSAIFLQCISDHHRGCGQMLACHQVSMKRKVEENGSSYIEREGGIIFADIKTFTYNL